MRFDRAPTAETGLVEDLDPQCVPQTDGLVLDIMRDRNETRRAPACHAGNREGRPRRKAATINTG